MVYRLNFFFILVGNLLYMTIIYFLWKSIYRGADSIHGMTFNQAFIYLALAGSMFNLFFSGEDWVLSNKILHGSISVDLLKPLDFQFMSLAWTAGFTIFNLVTVTFPSVLVLFLVFPVDMPLGIGLLFFPIGLGMAFLISFIIDFMVGLSAFYTESLWGISMTKMTLISLLSGALIPINYWPGSFQKILQFLPFQAIYNIPLTMVVSPNQSIVVYLQFLAIQVFWVLALFAICRLAYMKALKIISINGG